MVESGLLKTPVSSSRCSSSLDWMWSLSKNQVSLGIEDRVIRLESPESIKDYQLLLTEFYPDCADDISAIIERIHVIMGHLDVLYGIDNPAFLDMKEDRAYLVKVILPCGC